MNRDHILTIARNNLSDVSPVNEDIFRGELRINHSAPAGIFYLDLSGSVSAETFPDYQERLLADEYYNHPGTLQWNYYLLLLQDQVNPSAKEHIESNSKYARKYVLNEEDFEHFFTLERSTGQPAHNIVGDWKQKLDEVGLHDVYGKLAYTAAVEAFINNPTPRTATVSYTATSARQEDIQTIDKLILHPSFRTFPQQRHFTFGKANLLTGSNGAGKTSLLEAIELIVCGNTYRNSDADHPDRCVEAYINHNLVRAEFCTPSRTEKYRNRDFDWYNSQYTRSNFVHTSFNRFNFYNTDAAYEFSSGANEDDIKKALLNLILGPEYTYIQDRMKGFHDRIRPVVNNLKKELTASQATIVDSDALIKRLQTSHSAEAVKATVIAEVTALQFAQPPAVGENMGPLELVINQLRNLLEEALNPNGTLFHSLNDLANQISVFTLKKESYSTLKTELDGKTTRLSESQANQTISQEKQATLADGLNYMQDTRALELRGLRSRKSEFLQQLRDLQAVKTAIGTLELTNYRLDLTVSAYQENLASGLTAAKAELANINAQITAQLGRLNTIEGLVAQIKSLGKEWLSAESNPHSCPLCQTPFTRESLLSAIEREVAGNAGNQPEIDRLTVKLNETQADIETLTLHMTYLAAISLAYGFIRKSTIGDVTVASIIQQIESVLEQEQALQSSSASLQALEDWATAAGLTEDGFTTIERNLTKHFGATASMTSENRSNLMALQRDLEKETNQLATQIEQLQEERAALGIKIKTTLELPADAPVRPSEITNMFNDWDRRFARAQEVARQIQRTITIEPDTDLQQVQSSLLSLQKNANTLKSYYQDQEALKNAQDQKKKAEDYVSKTRPLFERIDKGYQLLIDLLGGDESPLNAFFDENLKEVSDIFRTIHAPREFSDIRSEGNQLYLFKNDGTKHKLSEISTGQRAALALSLFISLNRKLTRGPNIILFDDPIAHVDDMNVLSFLDFLRFFILKENRQIFFATANDRLAGLIDKKFSFLADDFAKISLRRE